MTDLYGLSQGDVTKGVIFAGWIFACDVALKALSRAGGCGSDGVIDEAALSAIYELPSCLGTAMAGPNVVLIPHAREGMLLGLGTGMAGFDGQIYGLGLLFVATALTILVARWQWRAKGDAHALAAIWAGAIVQAAPRLVGTGTGLAEVQMFGLSVGVGDFAFTWGVLWIAWRFIAEFRA